MPEKRIFKCSPLCLLDKTNPDCNKIFKKGILSLSVETGTAWDWKDFFFKYNDFGMEHKI